MNRTPDRFAPVDLVVVEFPDGNLAPEPFHHIRSLVDSGIIRLLDLDIVEYSGSGKATSVDVASAVATADGDLDFLIGASSKLLDDDDAQEVAASLSPGALAAVIVYEHVWMLPVADAIEASGARILTAAHVDPDTLLDALGVD
jgi:hypothetical protein